MDFTAEQRVAIETRDRDIVVTAGAGSGKTRVLVARFVTLLRTYPDWPLSSVVAITFTEKAAREMRDRIRVEIEREARAASEPAERLRWIEHQAALNSARIGTIHGLCAQILRANPAEARLDPGFEVLDENEANLLRSDALEAALAALGRETNPAADLLARYGVETVRKALRGFVSGGASDALLSDLDLTTDALLDRWQGVWVEAVRAIMRAAQADAALQAALCWEPPGGAWPDGDKLMDNWDLIHAHEAALNGDDPAAFAAAVAALAGGINRSGGKQDAWGGKEGKAACSATLKIVQDWAKGAPLYAPPGACDVEAAGWLMLWRDAIRRVAEIYAALKAARSALDFDDLEVRAARLLTEHPAIAARYAAEFNHVLVDEFQDTNDAQRTIVYALSGFRQSPGRLFVVGDPKQSIYAFRGADVRVFGAVHDDIVRQGGASLGLSESFRTHQTLVNGFNAVFEDILTVSDGPARDYEIALGTPMRAFRPAEARFDGHKTPLAVLLFDKPDQDDTPWQSADVRRWEAWTLAQQVHEMIADKTPVWDGDLAHEDANPEWIIPDFAMQQGRGAYRPMRYDDVAFLFQSTGALPLYEDVFKAAGLPYFTVSGRGYFNRQEVWDLLNLLRAVYRPFDDLALASVLRAPLFGLSDDALYALRRVGLDDAGRPVPLWEALFTPDVPDLSERDDVARDFARTVLAELRALAGRTTIAELLARALDLTGVMATLSGLPGGARRRGNVEKLLQLAEASGRVSLGAFLAYAQDLTAAEAREGEAAVAAEGAVTLMTVHSAKGLEFPVIVLPDASWGRGADHSTLALDPQVGAICTLPDDPSQEAPPRPFIHQWADALSGMREDAERRRLLYVAATRAQDTLIVSGQVSASSYSRSWLKMLAAALGIDAKAFSPGDTQRIEVAGMGCWIRKPDRPPDRQMLLPQRQAESGWDDVQLGRGEPVSGIAPALPPLLASVPHDPSAPARALTATHIAQLGSAPLYDPREAGWTRFRHAILFDAPQPLRELPPPETNRGALRGIIGEMVHRALQGWLLPGEESSNTLAAQLRAFAWERHLSDPAQVAWVVDEALRLLERFAQGPVPGMLADADEVYREVPFVFSTGRRTVHGVIDVLYHVRREQKGRGQWHVLDYKSSLVGWRGAELDAARYYLQVGVYAAAVEARTGQVPKTHLYYIHPARLVYVRPTDWQPALERLEADLQAALSLRP